MADPTAGTSRLERMPDRLRALMAQPYPAFSPGEMQRRRAATEAAMADRGITHLLIHGFRRVGTASQWLTGWPTTNEVIVLVTPGEVLKVFVQHYNHLPQARKIAEGCDVVYGGVSTLATALDELDRRDAGRLGLLGSFDLDEHDLLRSRCSDVVNFGQEYSRLRLVKSEEERDWMRLGAVLTDMAIDGLEQDFRLGMTEYELSDIVERPYLRHGGGHVVHFFGATEMADPSCCVPRQFPSSRRVSGGDVLFTEISTHFWFYSGQVLRTYTVAAEAPPLYQDLHSTAEAAFDGVCSVLRHGTTPAEVIAAASVIEDAGFTIFDDLIHGYGGGYFPPVLGSKSRMNAPLPDLVLEEGMFIVVQPNVITRDARAGVQVGEMVMITHDGVERFHDVARGLRRLDAS